MALLLALVLSSFPTAVALSATPLVKLDPNLIALVPKLAIDFPAFEAATEAAAEADFPAFEAAAEADFPAKLAAAEVAFAAFTLLYCLILVNLVSPSFFI